MQQSENHEELHSSATALPAFSSLHHLALNRSYMHSVSNGRFKWEAKCRELLLNQLQPEPILKKRKGDIPLHGCLFCIRLNEDASLLAATTAEGIEIWDPHSHKLIKKLKEHSEIVTYMTWFSSSPTPSVSGAFFSCSLDKTIKLWMDYKLVATYKDHSGEPPPHNASFSLLISPQPSLYLVFSANVNSL